MGGQGTTATNTWSARGLTDDVNTCDHCGRVDLKATVRMVIQDADGNDDGEQYMGVVCAARMTGRKAADIRTEANRADRARIDAQRAAWHAWQNAKSADFCARRDAALGAGASPRQILEWSATTEARAAAAAWMAANPAPPAPEGYR